MSEFYNESVKNRYLDEIENEGSRTTLSYTFVASKVAEEILEKDLYNFTKDEVYKVLENMPARSYTNARANLNNIKHYINYCIIHGYRDDNINPLTTIDRKTLSKFIDRTSKIYYSEEEMEDLIEDFDNAQDMAMIQLWFEGVMGRDFAEIKNLTYYDINWNTNELSLKDYDGSERKLTVSDKCMRYLENAKNQTVYHFYHDETKINEQPLFKSNFIFRNVYHHKTKEEGISSRVVYTRLMAIKAKFGLEYFTANSIKRSGQIYMAYQLYLRDGELKTKQFREIGERYKVTMVTDTEGESYPNVTLMKDYITSENLAEFYGVEVEIPRKERMKK
jgi:site-specific recombinase XerD